MALRKLAGPFSILTSDGDPISVISRDTLVHYPGVGLTLFCSGLTGPNYDNNSAGRFGDGVLTLDGVFEVRNTRIPWGAHGWWLDGNRLLMPEFLFSENAFDEFVLEPLALVKIRVNRENEPILSPALFPRNYGRVANRRIFFNNDLIAFGEDGVASIEVDREDSPFTGLGLVHFGPGRHLGEFFCWSVSGDTSLYFGFYNPVTHLFSRLWEMGPPSAAMSSAAYIPEFNIVASIGRDDNMLYIWALEVEPFAVSAPELIYGQERAGHVAQYRVRVLGDRDEPCEGELIDWSVDGVGTLLSPQSRTDEDGYATIRVMFGLDDVGECVLEASLRC